MSFLIPKSTCMHWVDCDFVWDNPQQGGNWKSLNISEDVILLLQGNGLPYGEEEQRLQLDLRPA